MCSTASVFTGNIKHHEQHICFYCSQTFCSSFICWGRFSTWRFMKFTQNQKWNLKPWLLIVFPEQHINRDSQTQSTKHSLCEDVVACSHFCNNRCGRRIDCWQKRRQRRVGVLTPKTTCAAVFAPFCVNMRDRVDLCLCVTEIPQHPWFLTIYSLTFDHFFFLDVALMFIFVFLSDVNM